MLLFERKNGFHKTDTRRKPGGQTGASRASFLLSFFLGHHLFQAQHIENFSLTIEKIFECVPEEPGPFVGQRSRKQVLHRECAATAQTGGGGDIAPEQCQGGCPR